MQRTPNRTRPAGRVTSHALRLMLVMMLALTAFSFIPGTTALAATGEDYLNKATDPHGSIWLPGTTDGTTAGPMDPGIDPTSASYGHLWTTDVPSGFCRIIATTFNPDGTINTPASLDRSTPGGCITAGGKAGGPDVERNPDGTIKRNADGTIYVYTPDWAVFSNGVYRMTYDPGKQVMTNAELLAPNRYPFNNKPFDVQLGLSDHKLYVANDKDGNIARFSGVSGPISQQTVETSVAKTTDGARSRAITFVCWSNLVTLNGGRGAVRAPGAPGCSPASPAPDLLIAQKSSMTVVLNAETCQTAPGGCTALPTPIKVLTPMGLRTDPKNPTIVYVSDSPGADAQIIRYNISTDVQDSYANFGILDDGTMRRFSFAFDVAFGPDHAMYVGDDPSAGATAFNGNYFRVAPNAPADTLGQPGLPASPPPPPSTNTGNLYGTGVTLASDSLWLQGALGGHLWIADGLNGLCRMDPTLDAAGNPIPGGMAENIATCVSAANSPVKKPEQSIFDAKTNFVYVADGGSQSSGVVRFTFNPATETLSTPQVIAAGFVNTGLGLDGQRASGVALDPVTDTLYVGFRARNLGANTQIARVRNASAADTSIQQQPEFIAKTTRTAPVFGLGIVTAPDGTRDLYIGDNKGVDLLTNVDACPAGGCISLLALNVRGPRGFATDGKDHLWLAGPPAPGTGNNTTVVQQYTISTGDLFAYSSVGVNPDNTQQQYQFVFSLGLNPATGDLYIADNPDAIAPPNGLGHVWKVAPPGATVGPSQPTITSKPGNPTNIKSPTFAFSTLTGAATFQCSLVATGSPDAFAACTTGQAFGPLADGAYTFKVLAVDAAGLKSAPAVYSFSVDTVVPVVALTAPASPTKVNTPSFTFSTTKNGVAYTTMSYQCSLSTGADAFAPCGSPQTYTAQADGAYTFKVRGTDLAGNVSADQIAALTIDTVAPAVTASPVGGQYTTAQSVTLTASADATAVSIFYTTDGTTPTATSTLYAGPIPVAATTTLKYIAVDAAGNQSAVGTQIYSIGAIAITAQPVSPTANSSPSFTFTSPVGATVTCTLSQGGVAVATDAACASPKTYTALADGAYTFTAAIGATDSATYAFTLDAAAPVLNSNPGNPSPSSTEPFTFSKPEATGWTFQCSFGLSTAADAFSACTSPKSYANTADGAYTFKVKAVDAAGTATSVQIYNFTVNAGAAAPTATKPVQSFTAPSGPASTTAIPVTLTWSGSTSATAFELQQSINGSVFVPIALCPTAPCNVTSTTVSIRPSDPNNVKAATTYTYQVRALNSTGTAGAWTAGPTFSVFAQDNSNGMSSSNFSTQNLTGAYNGSVSFSTTVGATMQNSNAVTMTGSSVALVSTVGPDRGMADVFVDGVKVATVDLYSSTVKAAQIVWKTDFPTATNGHTVKIVVTGQKNVASTGTRVDVDALLALK